ncbi:MAG: GTPase Era [Thermotoga sp.]|nr:MAG: GTPase Era [Thermotoga sp.]HDM70279.1 GTPase Era [Thermotogales bacterium]
MSGFKSGFVVVSGKPNVGKSTLINSIIGKKVSIVSEKPQTTRNRINCVYTTKDFQIVFVDTPGIHKPLHKLGEYLVNIAIRALKGMDLAMFVVDAERGMGKPDEYVANYLNESKVKVLGVINKIDLVRDGNKLKLIEDRISELCSDLVDIVKVSAMTGENLPELVRKIVENIPEGPMYYPQDTVTDRPLSFLTAEIIREKILDLTYEEVPHSVAVVIEEMIERENGVLYIRANILVERDSQKGIIIGKGGSMIKKIGTLAREELEFFTGKKIFLDLNVKVRKNWRNDDFTILNVVGLRKEIP